MGAAAQGVGSIGTLLSDIKNIEGDIKNGEETLGVLNELDRVYERIKKTVLSVVVPMLKDISFMISLQTTGLKNTTGIAAYVKGYQMTSAIRTLRNELQILVTALNVEGPFFADITHIVGELEISMPTVSGVQEKAFTRKKRRQT